jgi:hypothetical protein
MLRARSDAVVGVLIVERSALMILCINVSNHDDATEIPHTLRRRKEWRSQRLQ